MEKVNATFTEEKIQTVANKKYREALLKRLSEYDGDPKKAFTGKNTLDKTPLFLNELHTFSVPTSVKTVVFEEQYTIRKAISPDLKVDKVIDAGVRKILTERLKAFGNDAKKAFSNLEENPIYLNKEKGITIKSVKITGVSNAIALHTKKDHLGNEILDTAGNPIPTDFVNTGNNHHLAVYKDSVGNIYDEVVSFLEAVTRKNLNQPVIRQQNELGARLLFTLKQNEYFVFPNEKTGFDPNTIDLLDEKNYVLISPNLYRVQKFSKVNYGNSSVRDYVFRHHLESILNDSKELKDIAFKTIKSLGYLEKVVKVNINHLGRIIKIGEY